MVTSDGEGGVLNVTGNAVKPLPSGGGYKAYPASLGHNTVQLFFIYNIISSVIYSSTIMLVYEFKLKGKPHQYQAIDEAIRIVQFMRNKAVRYWMDNRRAKHSQTDWETMPESISGQD